MCGLVGMAGDLSGNKRKVFEELLMVDVVRGPHSTGVATVSRTLEEMCVAKAVGPPPELLSTKEYDEAMRGSFKVFMGHNRYATIGKVDTDNAHPFLFENVVGAHNGTLEYMCKQRLFEHEKFGTDSASIFSHINQHGLNETVKIIHNPTFNTNAFALVWYDKPTNTINFVRNNKRTLFYMYSEDRTTIFWSSEVGLLRWVLDRNNVKAWKDQAFSFDEDFHFRWTIPQSITTEFTKPIAVKLEKPERIPYQFPARSEAPWDQDAWYQGDHHFRRHGRGGVGHWEDRGNHQRWVPPGGDQQRRLALIPGPATARKVQKIDVKKWKPPYKDFDNKHLSKDKVMKRIEDGCVFCSTWQPGDFKWGDYLHFLKPDIDGRNLFLCSTCYEDDDIREMCEEMM